MKVIVHAGMHKTGSSSIQDSFHGYESKQFRYFGWRSPNHSALMVLLFASNNYLFNYHGHRSKGLSLDQLLSDRKEWMPQFDEALSAADERPVIISAESLTNGNLEICRNLAHHLRRHTDDVEVTGYVRPPISFMTSAYQQRLKGTDQKSFDLTKTYPRYRAKLEPLDIAFGRERVVLKVYDPAIFPGNDVVLDFASTIGVDFRREDVKRTNESLLAETISVLYLQSTCGRGMMRGSRAEMKQNQRFVAALRSIGRRKIGYARDLFAPALASNKHDIAWAEERLGRSLDDKPSTGDIEIASGQDMIQIAIQSQADLDNLAATLSRSVDPEKHALSKIAAANASPQDRALATAELIYDLCASPQPSLDVARRRLL